MEKQLLFVHGGDAFDTYEEFIENLRSFTVDPYASKKKWRMSLQSDLGKGYQVMLPEMPNKINAKYSEWKIWMDKYVPFLHDGVVLVGHSLGGVFLARYLSEEQLPVSVRALFLVSAPFFTPDSSEGGDFRLDTQKMGSIAQKTREIFIFHAKDDPVVPFSHAEVYRDIFPHARFLGLERGGHFIGETFPELLDTIRSLK